MGPINWNLTGVIKSDYPVVLEENVEHTRVSYGVDPAVYKFILAARMSAPTISKKVYEYGIRENREKLQKFASAYSSFLQRTGNERFWDLGYKGKPPSVHNLTLSLGRANAADAINAKDVEDSIGLYLKNTDTILDVNELWAYDKIPPSATMTLEERRIYSFLEENRDQNVQQIAQGLGFPEKTQKKWSECWFQSTCYLNRHQTDFPPYGGVLHNYLLLLIKTTTIICEPDKTACTDADKNAQLSQGLYAKKDQKLLVI